MSALFRFDPGRCTGCQACELACTIENRLPWGETWRRVWHFNAARLPGVESWHLSMACNHCAEAPCMRGCPALAYRRDAASGAVLLDPDRCLGCGYCAWVCPYEAPRYDTESGVMGKCTFCAPRLAEDREPACVALCPTAALGFLREEDLDEETCVASLPGLPETKIGPALRFAPHASSAPETDATLDFAGLPAVLGPSDAATGIGLAGEWPLLVFTFVASLLVAALFARAAGSANLHPLLFFLAGIAAPVFSLLHLGRKGRAWRASFNFRRSWLSRELIFYGLFVVAGSMALSGAFGSGPMLWIAVLIGFAALYAMDRVYDGIPGRDSRAPHSAEILLTGLFLGGVMAGITPVLALLGLLKLLAYLRRKRRFSRSGRDARPFLSILRLVLGFVLPVFLWLGLGANGRVWILLALAAGEFVDRMEFYLELELMTPGRQMALELARRRAAARA